MLLEFFLDPDGKERMVFGKPAPLVKMPRLRAAMPSRLNEELFGSNQTELPPMEDLFEALKKQSPELQAVLADINKEEGGKKKKVIVSRRRLFKELWLKGDVSYYWDSTLTSTMHGRLTTDDGIDVLFVDVERATSVNQQPPSASGYLFEQMCVEKSSGLGFFTLVCYTVGDYILLMSGEVDCKEDRNPPCYVELKLTSSHPKYFAPLPEEDKRRLWVAMELGGYGKVIRGHRDKFKEVIDMIAIEEYDALGGQLRHKTPQSLREELLRRVERMWRLFDKNAEASFKAADLIG